MSQFKPPFPQPEELQQPAYMQPETYQQRPLSPIQSQMLPVKRPVSKAPLVPVGVTGAVITGLLILAGVLLHTYHFGTGTSFTTQLPLSASIGQSVSVGYWQVTVKSVNTHSGDSISSPKSDNIYLVIDVTVVNVTQSNQLMASGYYFRLTDSSGQPFDEQFTDFGGPPEGTIIPNGMLRGQLIYEVPTTDHSFTLQLLGSNDPNAASAIWNITD